MPREPAPQPTRTQRRCERCLRLREDTKYELTLKRWLCNPCWFVTPPANPGTGRNRGVITPKDPDDHP